MPHQPTTLSRPLRPVHLRRFLWTEEMSKWRSLQPRLLIPPSRTVHSAQRCLRTSRRRPPSKCSRRCLHLPLLRQRRPRRRSSPPSRQHLPAPRLPRLAALPPRPRTAPRTCRLPRWTTAASTPPSSTSLSHSPLQRPSLVPLPTRGRSRSSTWQQRRRWRRALPMCAWTGASRGATTAARAGCTKRWAS